MCRGQQLLVSSWPQGAWSPANLAGLLLWLKADAGCYQDEAKTTPCTDATPVACWADQSGNGRDMSQATAGLRPMWYSGVKNGLAGLQFVVVRQLHGLYGITTSQPYSMFVVSKLADGAADNGISYYIVDGWDNLGRNMLYKAEGGTPDNWAMYGGVPISGGDADSNWHYWSLHWNTTASIMRKDGSQVGAGNTGGIEAEGMSVGATFAAVTGWPGYITEILVYDPALSDADRVLVEAYLAARWGI